MSDELRSIFDAYDKMIGCIVEQQHPLAIYWGGVLKQRLDDFETRDARIYKKVEQIRLKLGRLLEILFDKVEGGEF